VRVSPALKPGGQASFAGSPSNHTTPAPEARSPVSHCGTTLPFPVHRRHTTTGIGWGLPLRRVGAWARPQPARWWCMSRLPSSAVTPHFVALTALARADGASLGVIM
jgi:hypothetical protein